MKGASSQRTELETTPDVLNLQLPLFNEKLRKIKIDMVIPDVLTVTQQQVIASPVVFESLLE